MPKKICRLTDDELTSALAKAVRENQTTSKYYHHLGAEFDKRMKKKRESR